VANGQDLLILGQNLIKNRRKKAKRGCDFMFILLKKRLIYILIVDNVLQTL